MNQNKELLKLIKSTLSVEKNPMVIPVGNPVIAFLRPLVLKKEIQNKGDIEALTNYRNKFKKSFLTEFEANVEQTSNWLDTVVAENPSKIIFMVDDINLKTIGYMGLDFINWEEAHGEADAIVRGEEAPKGLMTQALTTLLSWAHNTLKLKSISVRVLSDNKAVTFYKKLGFVEKEQIPLKKLASEDIVSWIEDSSLTEAERHLVCMDFSMNLLED